MAAGALTDWNNLLLSCKYCNTRKGTKVKKGGKGQYIWPDEAYSSCAENLFHLVGLGRKGIMTKISQIL